MGNSSKLTAWLIANADKINLQVNRCSWTDEWMPGFYDYEANITLGSETYCGRGFAPSKDLAILKASAEAIERSVFMSSGLRTTSGIAIHEDASAAKLNALHELLERDAFFCHYLTKSAFMEIDSQYINVKADGYLSINDRLKKYGAEVKWGQMRSLEGTVSIACAINGLKAAKPFGVVLGLGCSASGKLAADHAFGEAIRNAVPVLEDQSHFEPITVEHFNSRPSPTVLDRACLGLDLEASAPTLALFKGCSTPPLTTVNQSLDLQITFRKLDLSEELSSLPMTCFLAESAHVQMAFFGKMKLDYLNLQRLSSFAGKSLSISDLESTPHVLA